MGRRRRRKGAPPRRPRLRLRLRPRLRRRLTSRSAIGSTP
jgi:hypothetical protein